MCHSDNHPAGEATTGTRNVYYCESNSMHNGWVHSPHEGLGCCRLREIILTLDYAHAVTYLYYESYG